ncbi:MAG: hypothetical protein ACI9DC_004228, partial [Gammaproteobacteria bacterium]
KRSIGTAALRRSACEATDVLAVSQINADAGAESEFITLKGMSTWHEFNTSQSPA